MSRWETFGTERVERRESALYVPTQRAHRGCPCLIFNKPNKWGSGLKIAVRQAAKHLPQYHMSVQNQFLPATVRTQEGEEVRIDTLGRWAFGAPGYRGHLLFEGGERNRIVIYYPEGSPKELLEMLEKAVRKLEKA